MEWNDVISVLTLASVVIGILLNITNMTDKKARQAASEARIEVKLDNIYSKVDGIEKKQSSFEAMLQDHERRLTRAEERLNIDEKRG